jgi:Holliday junction DNA helicase RuvB
VRDWAVVHDLDHVNIESVTHALDLYQIDSEGLDRLDIAVLKAVINNYAGGPVGLNTLSAIIGEEPETVETVCEPYLVREGFLIRTPKGRMATAKGWEHLGKQPPRTPSTDVNSLF